MRVISSDERPGLFMDMLAGDRSLLRRVFGRLLALFFVQGLLQKLFWSPVHVFTPTEMLVNQSWGHGLTKSSWLLTQFALNFEMFATYAC